MSRISGHPLRAEVVATYLVQLKSLRIGRRVLLTYQPILNEGLEDHAALLFSGIAQGVRAPNPEIPGGYVALVAANNKEVQKPLDALDRMQACMQRQVAFNQSILENEEEVSGISSGQADFLQDMGMDTPVVVCLNVGERMLGTHRLRTPMVAGRRTDVSNMPSH
jgi:hypothetical protein